MTRFFSVLTAAVLCAGSALPALAEQTSEPVRDRTLHFASMDANGDGVVSRAEWLRWFASDIHRRGAVEEGSIAGAPGEVELVDAQGQVRRLVARPKSLGGGALPPDLGPSYGDDSRSSPIAARQRMLREAQNAQPFPDFDVYDADGDGFVQSHEVHRNSPVRHDPIPARPKSR